MQIIRTSKFGDGVQTVRYTSYLSATEFRDIRALLNWFVIPSPIPEEEEIRKKSISFFTEFEIKRLGNICSQFNLSL